MEVMQLVNTRLLRGKMAEHGMTQDALATLMKIDRATLNRKINNEGRGFTVKEANRIAELFSLTSDEAVHIFFAETVADKRH